MRLNINWFVPPPMALVAEELGFYRRRDLEVEATQTRSSDQQFDALITAEADAAITAMDNVMMWNRRPGAGDLRIVAQTERTSLLTVVARGHITALDQLRNATLLVDSPDNGFVVALCVVLADAGLTAEDYRLDPVGGVWERFEALRDGRGDATLLSPMFDAQVLAAGCHVLARVNERYPQFPGQGLVARASRLPEVSAALAAWLDAMDEGRRWIGEHPDEALGLLEAKGFRPAAAETMLATMPETWTPDRKGVELIIAQRKQSGRPGADLGYSDLVDLGVTSRAGQAAA